MNGIVILGVISIIIGLSCIGAAYWAIHRKPTRRPAVVLGLVALLFLTVIPTVLAIFFATTNAG